ncbi:hypothetical protein GLOTRDRAFT_114948 [Gloeophyllum trabeum ATCC 11539]|uniref:Neuroguidin n=1 Tax=Gloeophyllum trabeum (strain ATCC 11539 / FP-39264 / Madison 617) TaxID=670483 RepID=S7QFH1_GLOTA|nr:uncharacterized protein GLOTRDRAFT_114948 [Gloeophyllum trabeum ATCC 11539]EPQ58576.1 hypothetical protein GLOTRDRAFT_114948 [Gloeophyllum trabeum ATCC 11539]
MDGETITKEQKELCDVVDEMTRSMSSVRELIQSLRAKSSDELDVRDGISLLSLKNHLGLAYLQNLTLVSAHRALGHSLEESTPPSKPFGALDREPRGSSPGDLVNSMVEGRVVLEKIKILEGRMRYQIEKLVRVAEEAPTDGNVLNDPLAFRPNPENLIGNDSDASEAEEGADAEDTRDNDGIYRPPKLAPVPYVETSKKDKSRRQPIPTALSSLTHLDPTKPYTESASGLGATPSLSSARAREIQRMTEFEEENMMRLVMKKKDAKRRRMDEEDIALGGMGGLQGRRRGDGLDAEFGDVLRSVGRSRNGAIGDGYEELRQRGKKQGALERSRARNMEDSVEEGPRQRKRGRFDKAVKATKRRMSSKSRK